MSNRTHISHLESEFSEFKNKLLVMASHAESIMATAVRSVIERDTSLANDAEAADSIIDRLEMEMDDLGDQIRDFFTLANTEISTVSNFACYGAWLGGREDDWPLVDKQLRKSLPGLTARQHGRLYDFWQHCRNIVTEAEESDQEEVNDTTTKKLATDLMPAPEFHKKIRLNAGTGTFYAFT